MRISARNQLKGAICDVQMGAVNAAIQDLALAEGSAALAIVKSTDVMVGIE